MRIAVVALGKIGLPLAVQFASSGHDVIGVDVNQKAVDTINAAAGAFPRGGAPAGEARRARPLGTAACDDRLRGRNPGADAVVWSPPSSSMMRRGTRLQVHGRRDPVARRASHARHARLVRDDPPRRHHARALHPMLEARFRSHRRHRLPRRVLTRAGAHRSRIRGPPQVPEAHRCALRRGQPSRTRVLRSRPAVRRAPGPSAPQRPCGDLGTTEASEMAKLAETTYRDVNIGSRTSSACSPHRTASTSTR